MKWPHLSIIFAHFPNGIVSKQGLKRGREPITLVLTNFQICIWGVQKLDECVYFGISQTEHASLVCCHQCLSVSHSAAIEGPSPVTCSKSLSQPIRLDFSLFLSYVCV